ncbi:uncharacterized protein BXIN_1410 [Babesia sp. Xinjiang]|uniref:uncharacterized protein n=1 Tax=Babesia sp. Xinjiang TaxID=462227 RepID=UPI000A233DBA|nr:uncharacterized protein BXIN_1410 [Babesia sp. Xinjiang]ORM39976.1 hypothetical protein BXIN_1410 [Babesia sp. Xinjiang]
MGSEQNTSRYREDIDFYQAVERYSNRDTHKDTLYLCDIPVVKRNNIHDMRSIETASTEAYVSQLVVRSDAMGSVDPDRLMTVSLPYDRDCDTDYENSGSEDALGKQEVQQGQGNDEDKNFTKGGYKLFSMNFELAIYMVIFVITNSAQPLLICLLRQKGGAPNGTYTFLIPTYLAMICVGSYPTKKSVW